MVGDQRLYQMIRYTTTVQLSNDPDEKDYYINIPEGALKTLGWNEGDTLEWRITDSKQIIVTKVKDAEQSQEEPRDFDERYQAYIEAAAINEASKEDWEEFWND